MSRLSLLPENDRPILEQRSLRGLEVVLAQVGDTMGPDLIVGDVHGPLAFDVLREACFRVQQLHPTLRAAIRWPGGRLDQRPVLCTFEPDRDALDVALLCEPLSGGAAESGSPPAWRASHGAFWQWAAQEQSRHRFDLEKGFLFRVVWVPEASGESGHLIVCSHHAVVDGTSLMRLLNQILQNVQAVHHEMVRSGEPAAQAAARLPAVVSLPLPPALFSHLRFSLLDKALSWVGRHQAVFEQKHFIRKPWLPLARNAATPLEQLQIRTECVFAKGEKANWEALHQRCKQAGVTVGGAFSAAVQFAICRHLRHGGMALPTRGGKVAIPLSMDYNMRERIDHGSIDVNAIGLGTSIAGVGVKVPADIEFWELAQRIMANARKQVKYGLPKLFQSVTDTIFGYRSFWKDRNIDHGASGGAGDGVNISNVGRYPFPTVLGPFALENVFGFNGACLSGPMFIFWLRQVNGRLCYNAIACSPAADRQMLNAVFGHVVEVMERLASTEASRALTLAAYSQPRQAALHTTVPAYAS
jgi:hypothetical protein